MRAKGISLSLCVFILYRNTSGGGNTACLPCSIQPPCCKTLARPFSLKSALGTMATSLTRPVSLWHQPHSTAVPYLMVRLTPTIPSIHMYSGCTQDEKHAAYLPSGSHCSQLMLGGRKEKVEWGREVAESQAPSRLVKLKNAGPLPGAEPQSPLPCLPLALALFCKVTRW